MVNLLEFICKAWHFRVIFILAVWCLLQGVDVGGCLLWQPWATCLFAEWLLQWDNGQVAWWSLFAWSSRISRGKDVVSCIFSGRRVGLFLLFDNLTCYPRLNMSCYDNRWMFLEHSPHITSFQIPLWIEVPAILMAYNSFNSSRSFNPTTSAFKGRKKKKTKISWRGGRPPQAGCLAASSPRGALTTLHPVKGGWPPR